MLHQKLEQPENSSDMALFNHYETLQKSLNSEMENWEQAHNEMEELEKLKE